MSLFPHTYRTERVETVTTNSVYGAFLRRRKETGKIKIQPELLKILRYADANRTAAVDALAEVVAAKSVAGRPECAAEVERLVGHVEERLARLGVRYERFVVGEREVGGERRPLPPVILGDVGRDPEKLTVLVYAYLDVPLPDASAWNTDPWKVTEIDKTLYGNGVASGKCALVSWFHLMLAFEKCGLELPVNLKFCVESTHHRDSEGLRDLVSNKKKGFFAGVDLIVCYESEWLGDRLPSICHAGVGLLHFDVAVDGSAEDAERILRAVVDEEGEVLVPHFGDRVPPISPEEELHYDGIEGFDPEEVRPRLPASRRGWSKTKLLMHFWRFPSACVDGVGTRRRLVVKIVPEQTVDESVRSVLRHVERAAGELKIGGKVCCRAVSKSRHWFEDFTGYHYQAARRAAVQIYKEDPSMIREDRDRKVLADLQQILECDFLLLPMGRKGMNAGRPNENIALHDYHEGVKFLAAVLFQLDYLKKLKDH